jgi:hypothetical protein
MIAMPLLGPREHNGGAFRAAVDALGRRHARRETFVECPVCGFEPAERPSPRRLLLPRTRCPKCHASCWRRTTRVVLGTLQVA